MFVENKVTIYIGEKKTREKMAEKIIMRVAYYIVFFIHSGLEAVNLVEAWLVQTLTVVRAALPSTRW